MPVLKTDEWLLEHYQDPIEVCKNIIPFFPGVSATEIYEYFQIHGMYQKALTTGLTCIETMKQNKIWIIVEQVHATLRKKWNGPDVPIIILPSNTRNPKLMKETNGKAGIAFSDKLILFVPETIDEQGLKSLFIHEYNHVCRLWHSSKDEKSFTLLDSIVLEGIAENAVRERLGEAHTSSWTLFYSDEKIEKLWRKFIFPNRKLNRSHPLHNQFLYGWRGIPKMAGYCVGYYLVRKYLNTNNLKSDDILGESSEVITTLFSS